MNNPLHFSSIALSILTAWDRSELAAGRNPGDNGSGRAFETESDWIYMTTPVDLERFPIARIAGDDEPPVQVELDLGLMPGESEFARLADAVIGDLVKQLDEANATITRVIKQRDAAVAERDATIAELRAELEIAQADTAAAEDLLTAV